MADTNAADPENTAENAAGLASSGSQEHENATTPAAGTHADESPKVAQPTAVQVPAEQAIPEQASAGQVPVGSTPAQLSAGEPASEQQPAAPTPKPHIPGKPHAPAKPHIPSPAALAKKPAQQHVPTPVAAVYSESDVKAAEAFGRVDDQGGVFVKEESGEREVGQFPDAPKEEALALYAHRFLDLKAKLDLFAARLNNANIKPHEIDESLKTLDKETSQPAVVGDLAALKAQLEALRAIGAQKKAEITEARKAAVAKALEGRTAIAAKAEELAASLGDSTNWRSTGDKFRSLFDQWQEHQRTSARLDKTDADALWGRFAAARSTFNQARRKWEQARDTERTAAKQAKEAIIAEAQAARHSTAWGETSRLFNQLMDRWKKAGRVGHNEDDALWTRFRQAADTFFNARQADRDQISSSEKENLAKKEELLKRAEALLPVADEAAAKKARQVLSAIQEEWDGIGYVPRDAMRRIENRLDAVDRQIKSVEDAAWKKTDPEADARKSSFEVQLTAQLDELKQKIAAESDANKKKALEAELATKEQWLKAIN